MSKSRELTFVLQGAIDRTAVSDSYITLELVSRIREYHPNCKIILSTWVGEDVSDFDATCWVVLNKDPGGVKVLNGKVNNYNRMLVSSQNGLKYVDSEYVIKLRTDLILHGPIPEYKQVLSDFPEFEDKYSFLSQRVITISYSSVDPRFSQEKLLFHPCDWFFYGKTNDVIQFFDAEIISCSKDNYYFDNGEYVSRFRAEQNLTLNMMRNTAGVPEGFENARSCTLELTEVSEAVIVNNIFITEAKELNLGSLKHPTLSRLSPNRINSMNWKNIYDRRVKKKTRKIKGFSLTGLMFVLNILLNVRKLFKHA